ncbi:phage late control D family protein [Methylorubrum populi]
MTYRRPYLKVEGPGGEDMIKSWGSKLIGVKIIDRRDGESDEATFMFTRKRPYMAIPGEGTPYTVHIGWAEGASAITGFYTFQRVHIFGNPKQSQQLHLICRGADFIEKLKDVDSGHFDAENGHKTLGDVFNSLFKGSQAQVRVHPDIAKRAITGGYLLRWNQSAIDFAQEVAEENGGVVKPLDGKILILKRGSGESASGQTLPTIQMPFDENYVFDFELEPRFSYQKVTATYLDTDKGTLEREEKTGGAGKGGDALPHPAISKEAAKAAAEAAAQQWGQFTGQGLFTKIGDPLAVSGAEVRCSGFGTPIDETKWEAIVVTHDVIPDRGWHTTVETEVMTG